MKKLCPPQPRFWASTRRTPQYFSRSLGFSIFPVGFRGTGAKMIFRGRFYRGRSVQYWLISLSVQVMPSFTWIMAAAISPSRGSGRPMTATSWTLG